jgi:glycosyltransferase involved in cell wall biosynthesis
MRLAYFVVPHLGGTFSVYGRLRNGLAPWDIDLVWVGVETATARPAADSKWAAERCRGLIVPVPSLAEPETARALLKAIGEEFDGAIFNVLSSPLETNLARYLPGRLLRLMVVHNCTPGTYAAAAAIRDHVHATVAVAPRIQGDLVARHGFEPGRTFVVANGTQAPPGSERPAPTGPLRLLFLGRVEDQAKGVLMLPRILRRLPEAATLTIAGDGPDSERLCRACTVLGSRVDFRGAVSPEAVPALLGTHDVLLMPSRFEGCPMVLLEAMAAGCVPVASHIGGITDAIVTHGVDGRLFPVGSAAAAAAEVRQLMHNPQLLAAHARQARLTAQRRFQASRMATSYRQILKQLQHDPPPIAEPLAIDDWSLPAGLRPGLRTHLPRPLKNALRTMRERFPMANASLMSAAGWFNG